MHRVLVEDGLPEGPGSIEVGGEEALHALRVKRVRPGEAVELLDGRGGVASGRVQEGVTGGGGRKGRDVALAISVDAVRHVPPLRPHVEVLSATPKGQHVEEMIDGLSQLGAAAWRPLRTERGVVDPRSTKLERLDRIACEAMKQCGRAWVLHIGEPLGLEDALACDRGERIVIADAAGAPWTDEHAAGGRVRVLIGPEGGFTPAELDRAAAFGAARVRFGPHIMRIETAAMAAAAVILSRVGPEPV